MSHVLHIWCEHWAAHLVLACFSSMLLVFHSTSGGLSLLPAVMRIPDLLRTEKSSGCIVLYRGCSDCRLTSQMKALWSEEPDRMCVPSPEKQARM